MGRRSPGLTALLQAWSHGDASVLEMARESVEMFRTLAAENRADSIRGPGVSLQRLGDQLKFPALSKKGPEWAGVMRQSRDAYAESLGIFSSSQDAARRRPDLRNSR